MAYLKVLSQHLSGGTKENNDKLRNAGIPCEMKTGHLLSTNQEQYAWCANETYLELF
jgi:hypothetical protein